MIRLFYDFTKHFGVLNTTIVAICIALFLGVLALLVFRKSAAYRKYNYSGSLIVYIFSYGCALSICAVQFYRENHDVFEMFPGSVPLSLSPATFAIHIAVMSVLILGLLHIFLLYRYSSFAFRFAKMWHFLHFIVMGTAPFALSYEIHTRYGKNFLQELYENYLYSFSCYNILFAFIGLCLILPACKTVFSVQDNSARRMA